MDCGGNFLSFFSFSKKKRKRIKEEGDRDKVTYFYSVIHLSVILMATLDLKYIPLAFFLPKQLK